MTMIGLVNQKGGVGKTTLTVHLAVALSRLGKSVIVIDGDTQGNTTSWLCNGDLGNAGMFRVLVVGDSPGSVLQPVADNLALLPGNGRTAEAMIFLAATNKPFTTVYSVLYPLTKQADYVLLDMPPSRAAGFSEMLYACDDVIVPTQLERLSMEGVQLMAERAASIKAEHGRGPRLLGIVPNMVRYTNEHGEQLEILTSTFGATVWPPLPLSVRVAESSAYGTTLFDLAPNDKITQAMHLVVERLVGNGAAA